jgi:DNA mismatch repair protein MutL
MPPIRALDQSVADAIAAGEVVERPASVIKELCENAIDAGARRIDITVEAGGLTRMVVSDDGRGIPADQLDLALRRHATSKIRSADDLAGITTLGFRGEALASIAAVSDLQLISRVDGAAAARLRVRGGEVVEQGVAARDTGTTVDVAELFATTPARLRFLRSERAEAAACVRAAGELALANPEVAVSCTVDGRISLRSPGGSLRDALVAVIGPDGARVVEVVGDGDVRVSGLIAQPLAHRGTRAGLVLAVNGRRIHHRGLAVAVEEAYRGLLPGGRYPFGVLHIELEPESVDVNVHPAKREVRFREEGRVFTAVQRACWTALQDARAAQPVFPISGGTAPFSHRPGNPLRPQPLALHDALQSREDGAVPPAGSGPEDAQATLASLAPLRTLGQSGSSWLVAETAGGVVLVDPHAAHEKVLYAQLLESWATASGADGGSQLLLLPVVLECSAQQMERLESQLELLGGGGFAVEVFGPTAIRCTAVPAAARNADAEKLLRDVLDSLEPATGPVDERRHRLAALIACHSAVRFGDRIAEAEQQRLLDQLVTTPGGITCPHGRPTVMVLTDAHLRQLFRRPAL